LKNLAKESCETFRNVAKHCVARIIQNQENQMSKKRPPACASKALQFSIWKEELLPINFESGNRSLLPGR
jgi:hypothetical protein